jgi:hypothetical protein
MTRTSYAILATLLAGTLRTTLHSLFSVHAHMLATDISDKRLQELFKEADAIITRGTKLLDQFDYAKAENAKPIPPGASAAGIISRHLQDIAGDFDSMLQDLTGERTGFAVLIFPLERAGDIQYISNAERVDMINALKSLLTYWKRGAADIPYHEKV